MRDHRVRYPTSDEIVAFRRLALRGYHAGLKSAAKSKRKARRRARASKRVNR